MRVVLAMMTDAAKQGFSGTEFTDPRWTDAGLFTGPHKTKPFQLVINYT